MPGDEDHAPRLRSELGCHRLGERAPLRGHQHKAHVAVARTQILYGTKHGLWLDHHPRAAAVRIVISNLVTPLRIVSQVHRTDVQETLLPSACEDTGTQHRLYHIGKQGEDVTLHGLARHPRVPQSGGWSSAGPAHPPLRPPPRS